MTEEPRPRSVKIGDSERGGWSSERPRREGAERPPNISVRCRVLSPSDHLRYSPGSLLVIVSASAAELDRFAARLFDNRSLLSLGKVRELLTGRVPEDELADRAEEVLDAAIGKRLAAGETAVIAADGLEAAERERYARLAAAARRPRHLLLLEASREQVQAEDLPTLNELRRRLDAGELGEDGFQTAVRVGGDAISELKRIVFQHPPRED
jgi:predicted kinase